VRTETPIHDVKKTLESLGLEVFLYEKNENVPFDVAIVPLGDDEKKRPIVLQVQQYTQNIATNSAFGAAEEPVENVDLQMLNFLVTIPVDVQKEFTCEIVRFLALANKSFPLGSLNFSEIERAAYFSYGYPVFSNPPCEMTLLMILNTIMYARETFFPGIDDIVSGGQTVDMLIGTLDQP
jgi:hypothetical protein